MRTREQSLGRHASRNLAPRGSTAPTRPRGRTSRRLRGAADYGQGRNTEQAARVTRAGARLDDSAEATIVRPQGLKSGHTSLAAKLGRATDL